MGEGMTVKNKRAHELYNEIIEIVQNEFRERHSKEDSDDLEKAYVLVAVAMMQKIARGVVTIHGRDRFYDWWDEINQGVDDVVNETTCEMTRH